MESLGRLAHGADRDRPVGGPTDSRERESDVRPAIRGAGRARFPRPAAGARRWVSKLLSEGERGMARLAVVPLSTAGVL